MFHLNYLTPSEFFTSVLSSALSMEFEWQKVSSGLRDSSQYSSWSNGFYSLDGLDSSTDFQFIHSLLQTLLTAPRAPTRTGITVTLMVHSFFFRSQARSKYFYIISLSLFSLCHPPWWQSPLISFIIVLLFWGLSAPALAASLSLRLVSGHGMTLHIVCLTADQVSCLTREPMKPNTRVMRLIPESLGLSRPSSQAITISGGVGFITWRLRRMPTGPKAFCNRQTHVGSDPAPGFTLKRPCAIFVFLVGWTTNTEY